MAAPIPTPEELEEHVHSLPAKELVFRQAAYAYDKSIRGATNELLARMDEAQKKGDISIHAIIATLCVMRATLGHLFEELDSRITSVPGGISWADAEQFLHEFQKQNKGG